MYNPEDDVIPVELIQQALELSKVSTLYRVYFDKETGHVLSVTNEENKNLFSFIEVEYEVVKDFLVGKKQSTNYKVVFVNQTTPAIILQTETDVDLITLDEVPLVTNWDNMFTIENYPLQKQWGFQLRPDQRDILKLHNLNTSFEIFIVDKNNSNFLYRTIKILLKNIIENDRFYVDYTNDNESNTNQFNIFVKKFFQTVGYQILYDTKS